MTSIGTARPSPAPQYTSAEACQDKSTFKKEEGKSETASQTKVEGVFSRTKAAWNEPKTLSHKACNTEVSVNNVANELGAWTLGVRENPYHCAPRTETMLWQAASPYCKKVIGSTAEFLEKIRNMAETSDDIVVPYFPTDLALCSVLEILESYIRGQTKLNAGLGDLVQAAIVQKLSVQELRDISKKMQGIFPDFGEKELRLDQDFMNRYLECQKKKEKGVAGKGIKFKAAWYYDLTEKEEEGRSKAFNSYIERLRCNGYTFTNFKPEKRVHVAVLKFHNFSKSDFGVLYVLTNLIIGTYKIDVEYREEIYAIIFDYWNEPAFNDAYSSFYSVFPDAVTFWLPRDPVIRREFQAFKEKRPEYFKDTPKDDKKKKEPPLSSIMSDR